jgi:hypothetical protein
MKYYKITVGHVYFNYESYWVALDNSVDVDAVSYQLAINFSNYRLKEYEEAEGEITSAEGCFNYLKGAWWDWQEISKEEYEAKGGSFL